MLGYLSLQRSLKVFVFFSGLGRAQFDIQNQQILLLSTIGGLNDGLTLITVAFPFEVGLSLISSRVDEHPAPVDSIAIADRESYTVVELCFLLELT